MLSGSFLLKQFVLQLVRQTFWMLRAWCCSEVFVPLASSSRVKVLVFHAGSQGYLGDGYVVFPLRRLDMRGSDVGRSTAPCTECAISVVADHPFADYLAVSVPVTLSDTLRTAIWDVGRSIRGRILANVSSSYSGHVKCSSCASSSWLSNRSRTQAYLHGRD